MNDRQYQQNEQAPLIISELTEHKNRPRHMTLEIQVLASDRHKNVAGLNRLMGSQPPLLITGRKSIIADYLHRSWLRTGTQNVLGGNLLMKSQLPLINITANYLHMVYKYVLTNSFSI